jgi:hypothetical protein
MPKKKQKSTLTERFSSVFARVKNSFKKKTSQGKDLDFKEMAHVSFEINKERNFKRYIKYLSSPMHIMWRNFLAGTFHALGFVIGSAIVISLFGFFTTQVLQNISFFSDFADAVNIWLDNTLDSQ